MLQLDEVTIYQIFYQYHKEASMSMIALELGICRQTVSTHLSWQRYHLYSERLRRRIADLKRPKRSRTCPEGFIAMEEASYFFPNRPTTRELAGYCQDGWLQSVRYYKQPVTTREWIREWIAEAMGNLQLEGAFVTASALKILQATINLPNPITRTVMVGKRSFQLASLMHNEIKLPSRTISRAVAIQEFTALPYVVLAPQDLT
jgi:hypothetical protein